MFANRGGATMSKNNNFEIFEIAIIAVGIISTAMAVWLIFSI